MTTTVRGSIKGQYNSIAEARADRTLKTGQTAKTSGYYEAGDGGGAEYVVVAGGTGVDDGGSYLDMANGNQLELIYNSEVSVLQFGALFDGTTDDTVPIQSAINVFPSGGTVWLPNRKGIVTDTITIDQPIQLMGRAAGFEGLFSSVDFITKGSTLELASGSFNSVSKPIINVTYNGSISDSRVNCVLRDFVVHGNRGVNQNPVAEDAKNNNSFGVGVQCAGGRYLRMDNVYCIRCAEEGFKSVTGGSQNVSPNNLSITNSAFLGNSGAGISVSGGDLHVVDNQCGYNGSDGFIANGLINVVGGLFWDNFGTGIRVLSNEVTITGGQAYDNQGSGILISGDRTRVNVTGVVCQDNGKDTELPDSQRCGILVSGAAFACTITGAQTSNKDESGATGQRFGIYIAPTADVLYSNISGDGNGLALLRDYSDSSGTMTSKLIVDNQFNSVNIVSASSPFTPNTDTQDWVKMNVLTGNISINAPEALTTGTIRVGARKTFQFQQDATGGRAIAWDSVYINNYSDAGNSAWTQCTISFIYSGADWVQEGGFSGWM